MKAKKGSSKESFSSPKSPGNKGLDRLFSGLVCLVDAFTDDGLNAGSTYIKSLSEKGALVVDTLGENVTHMISANSSAKRLAVANLLGVKVVSPLWIEQCIISGKISPETDFAVSSTGLDRTPIKEPVINTVSSARDLDSPFFSSSQRDFSEENESKNKMLKPKKKNSAKMTTSENPIPVPSFKEVKIKNKASITTNRRSERICDISKNDDENSEEECEKDNENDLFQELTPRKMIDPYAEIPVIRAGRTSNVFSTPPLSSSDEMSENSDDESNGDKKTSKTSSLISGKKDSSSIPAKEQSNSTVNKSKTVLKTSSKFSESDKFEENSAEKKNASSRKGTAKKKILGLALSGFQDLDGEKTTLKNLVSHLTKSLGSSRLLSDDDDIHASVCDYLIIPENSPRTLRVLRALLEGIPILIPDFLNACLCENRWLPYQPYLHPRYSHHFAGFPSQISLLLRSHCFWLGPFEEPSITTMKEYITSMGGKTTENIDEASELILGTHDDVDIWWKILDKDLQMQATVRNLAMEHRILSRRYIFDLLEKGKYRKPSFLDEIVMECLNQSNNNSSSNPNIGSNSKSNKKLKDLRDNVNVNHDDNDNHGSNSSNPSRRKHFPAFPVNLDADLSAGGGDDMSENLDRDESRIRNGTMRKDMEEYFDELDGKKVCSQTRRRNHPESTPSPNSAKSINRSSSSSTTNNNDDPHYHHISSPLRGIKRAIPLSDHQLKSPSKASSNLSPSKKSRLIHASREESVPHQESQSW